jgi:electron transport complex protein RnfG
MKQLIRLTMVLFVTCFAAAGVLALVNEITRQPIEESGEAERNQAKKDVQPQATEFRETVKDHVWEAVQNGQIIGHVISTEIQGYSGPIKMIFGIDPEEKITDVKIISQTETPGLGAKITTAGFISQYRGQIASQVALKKGGGGDPGAALQGSFYAFPSATKTVDEPGIDAITGATISSRAVTACIRQALTMMKNPDAATGVSVGGK